MALILSVSPHLNSGFPEWLPIMIDTYPICAKRPRVAIHALQSPQAPPISFTDYPSRFSVVPMTVGESPHVKYLLFAGVGGPL